MLSAAIILTCLSSYTLASTSLRVLEAFQERGLIVSEDCAQPFVNKLGADCSGLSQDALKLLAVDLTNCHLSETGQSTILCDGSSTIRGCDFSSQSAHSTYTQFLLSSQTLCMGYQQAATQRRASMVLRSIVENVEQSADRSVTVLEVLSAVVNSTDTILSDQVATRAAAAAAVFEVRHLVSSLVSERQRVVDAADSARAAVAAVEERLMALAMEKQLAVEGYTAVSLTAAAAADRADAAISALEERVNRAAWMVGDVTSTALQEVAAVTAGAHAAVSASEKARESVASRLEALDSSTMMEVVTAVVSIGSGVLSVWRTVCSTVVELFRQNWGWMSVALMARAGGAKAFAWAVCQAGFGVAVVSMSLELGGTVAFGSSFVDDLELLRGSRGWGKEWGLDTAETTGSDVGVGWGEGFVQSWEWGSIDITSLVATVSRRVLCVAAVCLRSRNTTWLALAYVLCGRRAVASALWIMVKAYRVWKRVARVVGGQVVRCVVPVYSILFGCLPFVSRRRGRRSVAAASHPSLREGRRGATGRPSRTRTPTRALLLSSEAGCESDDDDGSSDASESVGAELSARSYVDGNTSEPLAGATLSDGGHSRGILRRRRDRGATNRREQQSAAGAVVGDDDAQQGKRRRRRLRRGSDDTLCGSGGRITSFTADPPLLDSFVTPPRAVPLQTPARSNGQDVGDNSQRARRGGGPDGVDGGVGGEGCVRVMHARAVSPSASPGEGVVVPTPILPSAENASGVCVARPRAPSPPFRADRAALDLMASSCSASAASAASGGGGGSHRPCSASNGSHSPCSVALSTDLRGGSQACATTHISEGGAEAVHNTSKGAGGDDGVVVGGCRVSEGGVSRDRSGFSSIAKAFVRELSSFGTGFSSGRSPSGPSCRASRREGGDEVAASDGELSVHSGRKKHGGGRCGRTVDAEGDCSKRQSARVSSRPPRDRLC